MKNNFSVSDLVMIRVMPLSNKESNLVFGVILKIINSDYGKYCHVLYGKNKITYKYLREINKI